ncbi:MAG TPA: hypothetical protein VHW65_07370 [Gemmatimonadales bacterium]|jgi:hypothetical protein|nr:hypothetical protein [Gemmatimonadales bacterium]
MRRHVAPVLGVLLSGILAGRAGAQRSSDPSAFATIYEPRPNPVLPAVLIPFTIGPESCKRGHVPVVTLEIDNSLAQSEAVVRLRQRNAQRLDSLPIPMRCGDYVATWDGTIDGGKRVAPPAVYWLNLSVDGRHTARSLLVGQP